MASFGGILGDITSVLEVPTTILSAGLPQLSGAVGQSTQIVGGSIGKTLLDNPIFIVIGGIALFILLKK